MSRFSRTLAKTARARQLRREATRPEQKLWFKLRSTQFDGHSFRRQHPVGRYFLDFYCTAKGLAIELDGEQHGTIQGRRHDDTRAQHLADRGIRVLRFWNHELRENLDGVMEAISRAPEQTPTRPASPRLRRTTSPLQGEENTSREHN